MRINHNIASLNTYRQLNTNTTATSKNIERLSSGLRINRAGDDAAGLAISEKMRGQIRGLDMASKNGQDGISLIQTAEGALNETHSILQRMRELAVQSSNDTNTADDRNELQKEISQLKDEIDRISSTTEFNTKKLLNGNVAATATVGGTNAAKIGTAEVVNTNLKSGTYTLEVSGTDNKEIADVLDAGTKITSDDISIKTAANAAYGQYQLKIEDDKDNAGMKKLTLINSATGEVAGSANNVAVGADKTAELAGIEFKLDNAENGTINFEVEGDHTFTLKDSNDATVATVAAKNLNKNEVEIGGLKVKFNADITDGTNTSVVVMNNSLTMQIGANEGQTMNIGISDMSAKALGVAGVDVTSAAGAQSAITTLDNALKQVSSERSKLGAYQNRLEHTINNLNTSSENLTAAESRIRDTDMAKEMMEQTKNNILAQAAQAMLAQANQQPQGVLQLLR
ncbi:flagellin [Brevibacillus borstelensis]|uniref:flagellin N-terminal helical domain-containing protein n=1 Tax=Brevibacillus borstelensis TaxID=45462 RepID=UPI00203F5D33|nr:flagellin [Brevibacillus borstelensis]MCM3623101.1 flagellin [Brevibacillus borstelensis]